MRKYDLLVFGATGFTGQLVCEQIARNYERTVTWAMAGRSLTKLRAVQERICSIDSSCKVMLVHIKFGTTSMVQDLPILEVDMRDDAALDAAVSQATVVLSAAGPFTLIGAALVDACVRCGTHYCDTTGEALWVETMIRKHHTAAAVKGVKIVHCCAYDSIPADLGTLLVVRHIEQAHGRKTARVKSIVGPSSSGASGGTISSALLMAHEPAARLAASASPYFLCGAPAADQQPGCDGPDDWGMGYNKALRTWTQPFLLQFTDRRVVHRSNMLMGHSYGNKFTFQEVMAAPNMIVAFITMVGTAIMLWLMLCRPLHSMLRRMLLQPGEGPPITKLKGGFWGHTVVGYPEMAAGQPPLPPVIAYIGDAHRDAGYWGTARMLVEAGLCLVEEAGTGRKLASTCDGGVLTPASAMGDALIQRLRHSGMQFDICLAPASETTK